jgi:hypothetical protein
MDPQMLWTNAGFRFSSSIGSLDETGVFFNFRKINSGLTLLSIA